MAQFTTRVELHNADRSDYVRLHEKMKQQGFSQTIRSDEGKIYELPPAEYNFTGDLTNADVLARAKMAAAAVKPSYAVLVTKSGGRTWEGLKQVA